MQGTGNDFILFTDFENLYLNKEAEVAIKLCDRHFGIGADGILIVRKSEIADIEMVIINADGSYAGMCGNGIRCFAKYVWDNNIVKKDIISIETGDGVKLAYITSDNKEVSQVTINMGVPSFDPAKIPASCHEEIENLNIVAKGINYKINSMLMGVPHTVIFGELKDLPTENGANIEKHDLFPKGTNVNFCQIYDREHIRVETWERGAGATLACGTGCCASVVAANKLKLVSEKVQVKVPGGSLLIELKADGVYMTGAAVTVFTTEFNI